MASTQTWILSALAVLALSGCDRASSPATVQNNVAKASAEAAQKDRDARESQAKTDIDANADAARAEQKADERKADSAYDVAVTEAEGTHKIAIEKCNAMTGDAQKACKEQADAKLDLAKANAKAAKSSP
jgi:hypothetical protein